MTQRVLEPPHCSEQMEALLQIKRQSWKGGQITSIVCSIDHQAASMRMLSSTGTEAPFLDLHLFTANGFVSSKIYDKCDDSF